MSIGSKFRGLRRNIAATRQGVSQADEGARKQYQKNVAADIGMGAADAALMSTGAGQIYTGVTGKTFSDTIGYESKTPLGQSIDTATDTAASGLAVAAPIAAGITVGVATKDPMLGVKTYQGVRGVQGMTGAYDEREGNNSLINMQQANQAMGFVDAAAPMVEGMGNMGGTPTMAYGGWLDNYTPERMMQNGGLLPANFKGGNVPDISSVKYPNEFDGEFDLALLKKGLSHVESSDGTDMMNPESSATGLYGQLFNAIADRPELEGITREQFAEDLDLQNEIFQMRYDGRLEPGTRTGIRDSVQDLRKKYDKQLKSEEINDVELGALINFLGRDGARQYLGYHVRDGRPLEDVFPDKFGPGAEQANKTPREYIEKFREVYEKGGRIKNKKGNIKPYITYDPNDPRIQAYSDSTTVSSESKKALKYFKDNVEPRLKKSVEEGETREDREKALESVWPLENNDEINTSELHKAFNRLTDYNDGLSPNFIDKDGTPVKIINSKYDDMYSVFIRELPKQEVILKRKDKIKKMPRLKLDSNYTTPERLKDRQNMKMLTQTVMGTSGKREPAYQYQKRKGLSDEQMYQSFPGLKPEKPNMIDYKYGGKSRVNEAGNYTKPTMRKRIFQRIKAGTKGGNAGQWSARKAQMLAKAYKAAGGGYKS